MTQQDQRKTDEKPGLLERLKNWFNTAKDAAEETVNPLRQLTRYINTAIAGLINSFVEFLKSATLDVFGSGKFSTFLKETLDAAREPVAGMLMFGDDSDRRAAFQRAAAMTPAFAPAYVPAQRRQSIPGMSGPS